MFIADLLIALVSGLIIVWFVSLVFDTRGPWGSLWRFYLVASLIAWAGGIWIAPFGPHWRGTGGMSILVMGIFVSLLIAAVSPRSSHSQAGTQKSFPMDINPPANVDEFFWVLILCSLVFGFGHYAWYPRIT